MRVHPCFRAIPSRVPPVFLFFVVVQRRAVKAPVPASGAEGGLAVPAERVFAEGLVRILPETGLAETVTLGAAEVAPGRTVLPVIEAGEGRTTLLPVLAFVAVTIVEVPGTEAVLAERPVVVITARAEGTSPFFPLAIHEAVTTGTEGTFVLTIPAEGGSGLRGIVAVTGGIGEGAGPEGLVRILPETGLAEAVAVGTAEVAAGSLVLFVIEAGKGAGTLPGVQAFVAVTVVEVPGTEAVLAERTPLVIAARTEGTLPFFSIAAHETVATGMEGTFVLAIPAEGGPGGRRPCRGGAAGGAAAEIPGGYSAECGPAPPGGRGRRPGRCGGDPAQELLRGGVGGRAPGLCRRGVRGQVFLQ